MLKLITRKNNDREPAAPATSAATLDRLWNRYVRFAFEDSSADFIMGGREYETVLLRYKRDPRAAVMYFDLRVKVAADQLVDETAFPQLREGEKRLADILTAGMTHEAACMKYLGEIPEYPDNVLSCADEDWSGFTFARESDAAALPGYIRAVRADMIGIPDYSNIIDLPRPAPLAMAN